MSADSTHNDLIISYLTLRRVIGALGVLFPVVLAIGCLWWAGCDRVEPSISDYYATGMRDIFVGVLFAIGWFLFAYTGYEPKDNWAGNVAGLAALGVALFPNTEPGSVTAMVHYGSAAVLFLTLAYFSFFLFTKSKPGAAPTPQKITRNRVYRVCAIVMFVAIGLIAILGAFGESPLNAYQPVFWLESVALWAFGFSWFVKGETLFQDRHPPGATA